MDYALENLGPEKFQEICHALLTKSFPKAQCFPVGQRDGGRDAISYFVRGDSKNYFVFQVKYVRKPLAEKEIHKWLSATIEGEAPKIWKLIPKGAEQFFLLTNLPGTAYPKSGSIDSVQNILNKYFEIPAQCWWRDDLNRRLDSAWDIKWAYPEIMQGPDILRYIVEHGLSENASKRTLAIRTFIRDQFDRDKEVRFKQVELQNELLDLFVDVPLRLGKPPRSRKFKYALNAAVQAITSVENESEIFFFEDPEVGVASFLLNEIAQSEINRIVIEGAPGQGKSTITQYICQIHRSRILGEHSADGRISEAHRNAPVRIPFKTDCRDLAMWLDRQNPFSADETTELPRRWNKSLEAFLAAQIEHHSGGVEFDVSDLHSVLKISSILLVFDGLDEVADIEQRKDVVEEIAKGVNRLNEVSVSVQSVVTSRPAAFPNSPSLPESDYHYLQLGDLGRTLILEYSVKWLKARGLDQKESTEFRRTLNEKLDQPHLRDLSRNPMQLAILLSLIQTRGGSLPDKRTALYDSYIELFLNREAEKSSIVRDQRELLVNLHGYLAWILHTESQLGNSRGSVNSERLYKLISEYLDLGEHEPALADKLMAGVVERFFALVSRVEGTYEFEVQPLREYFAARHLYNTAPYSPPGKETHGTISDRFRGMSRDFFWLNVTRFYAGCYSIGELPSLVEGLQDLSESDSFRYTSHPQTLAATLLSDWVFAQQPKSMKKVVALVLSGMGLRKFTSGGRRYSKSEPFVLPSGSGREELLEYCFELLQTAPRRDFELMVIELLRANGDDDLLASIWEKELLQAAEKHHNRWFRYGQYLGVLSKIDPIRLGSLSSFDSSNARQLRLVLESGHVEWVEGSEEKFRLVLDNILDHGGGQIYKRNSLLGLLSQFIDTRKYSCAFSEQHPVALSSIWDIDKLKLHEEAKKFSKSDDRHFKLADSCRLLIATCIKVSESMASDWAVDLKLWDKLVETAREQFGDRWAFYQIANVAAGIRSKEYPCNNAEILNAPEISLCERARFARLKANAPRWWESQLLLITKQEELAFALLVFFTWAGPTLVTKIYSLLDNKLSSLEEDAWFNLYTALAKSISQIPNRGDIKVDVSILPKTISERLAITIATRLGKAGKVAIYSTYLSNYDGSDQFVLLFCQTVAVDEAVKNPNSWKQYLPVVSHTYAKGVVSQRFFGYRFAATAKIKMMPLEIAKNIIDNFENYPTELVGLAELICRGDVADKIIPVGKISDAEKWFEQE